MRAQVPSPADHPGLRERKKASTRAAIQRHALRLFREQGYEATTVGQIAEAAEISESTFFRYFPTKEDVVLWDDFDPRVAEAFRSQPAGCSTIGALRAAIREALSGASAEDLADVRQRMVLMLSIRPLRAAGADQFLAPNRLLAELVAERTGRGPEDRAVRTLVGAMIGACLAAVVEAVEDPRADWVALVDEALAHLEAGLPL
jgi:AcrR family transcriptional regulator